MYDTDIKKVGEKLREYRKSNDMSLEDLGKLIGKSKGTVGKYETGDIIIDLITLLEICNILNIDFNSICNITTTVEKSINPFNNDILYLYYISRNGILISKLEIEQRNYYNSVIMKNGLTDKKNKPYLQEYVGTMESNLETSFICLTNAINNPRIRQIPNRN